MRANREPAYGRFRLGIAAHIREIAIHGRPSGIASLRREIIFHKKNGRGILRLLNLVKRASKRLQNH